MVFPIALQIDLYASKAASVLSPHKSLICPWTSEESFPHSVGRSAGLLSVLHSSSERNDQQNMINTHLTAANRHAGGMALTSRMEMAKRANNTLDLVANIVKNTMDFRIGRLVNES